MQHILAFFDEDQIYSDRFKKFASAHSNCPFTVYSFHDYKTLESFSRDHPIELLVGSEAKDLRQISDVQPSGESSDYGTHSSPENPIYKIPAKSLIRLSESKAEAYNDISQKNKDHKKREIYKYQSGENILREIMSIYGKKESGSKKAISGEHAKLYLIYSPIGRSGKTTFARSLTRSLSKDCNVLYMTLEEVSDLEDSHCDALFHDTMSEAFYFFKEGKLTESRFRELIYHSEEYDHILPVRTPEDLTTLDSKELIDFMEHVRSVSGKDAIVLDTDSILSRVEGLLPQASRIFMPVMDDRISNLKLELLESHLSKTQPPEVLNNITKLIVPDTSKIKPSSGTLPDNDPLLEYASAVIKNYIYY
ncbi:hypothetical protein [Oribacterium sp. P6A1]|uniref:hypothetical protein n=1 Tax=Oribacterium sp. P6A1 TaxID=1410612 RepID=UPI000569BBC1|nr:hypothetical protein [Oribacterium sp. P6A1]